MNFKRSSGILLHPVSLPGAYGIGDLGSEAYKFIDFLAETEQKIWQTLPLGPTGYGNSPYACFSAFAGNPIMISPELLLKDKLLTRDDLKNTPEFNEEKVEYEKVLDFKYALFQKAFLNFKTNITRKEQARFHHFCDENHHWLHDYALFMSIKNHYEDLSKEKGKENNCKTWADWESDLVARKPSALRAVDDLIGERVLYQKFLQYQFFKQWHNLKLYANEKGIMIVGDIPIFVAYDSADVWSNPDLFQLDEETGLPLKVAGVPPDYFSETGQLWGNPLYDWETMSFRRFDWWVRRFSAMFSLVDIVRVDHFRGFEAFWSIPYGSENAINGEWVKAPGRELFHTLKSHFGELPVIAEDLGIITPEVEALRDEFAFPGMKVLQFAFSSDAEDAFLPHNHIKNCVVYSGTHDNDTSRGWFENSSTEKEREYFLNYTNSDGKDNSWTFIRMGMASVANTVIFPLQDLMSLGTESRMNMPSRTDGNWDWRYTPRMLTKKIKHNLKKLTDIYGRSGKSKTKETAKN